MEVTTLVVVTLVTAMGTWVQTTIGFGLNVLAAPLLRLVAPTLVPGPALVANLVLTALVAWRDRAHAERRAVLWAALGSCPGTAAGIFLSTSLPAPVLDRVFAGLVLAAVGMTVVGARARRTPATLLGVGFASAVMGTTTALNGPPMALAYRGERGGVVRGTVALFGVWTSALSAAAIAMTGPRGWSGLDETLVLLPGLTLGVALGQLAPAWRSRHAGLSRLTLAISVAAALALLARVTDP